MSANKANKSQLKLYPPVFIQPVKRDHPITTRHDKQTNTATFYFITLTGLLISYSIQTQCKLYYVYMKQG